MVDATKETNFSFPGQTDFYRGKVRDVYSVGDLLVMVASDRISAFDVVLPRPIPHKGQVLNQLAVESLRATQDIVPNWLVSSPHPNVSIGKRAEPFAVEMVIRGYLVGHAWRTYSSGMRELCGVTMPDNMKENDKFPEPIITPTTKAHEGHDEDISREDIIEQGIVSEADYQVLEDYTKKLFAKGTELAAEHGLILVDTKYEFGKTADGEVILIDEIHTPDSSRFFYTDGYQSRTEDNPPKQLSKEFVRQWLIDNGFQGKTGQSVPEMTDEFVNSVSQRYIELYEQMSGQKFSPSSSSIGDIESVVKSELKEQ